MDPVFLMSARKNKVMSSFKASKYVLAASLFLFGVNLASEASLEAEWTIQRSEDGIDVYTRPEPASQFEAVRAVMTLDDVRLSSLVALISDTQACSRLESRCVEAETLDTIDQTESVVYRYNNMPFPVRDRDMVLRLKWYQQPDSLNVNVVISNVTGFLPEKKRRVRMPKVNLGWKFVPLPDGSVEVSSEGHIEPGANLPAWILNQFLVSAPFKTMEAVASIVREPLYRDAELSFIKEVTP
ncbi:MAG: START domain-containing protein [Gammaproteobacteria bacterium]|nr:START domain-containing protein [Gammaproteobacteria bacterium]MDG2118705.1 START domain-containing protein [Gammaproteobacteria bacterium]|tara:strand:+ start:1612 stop:2334 length:723 start_codon:yes stop_codon:yes gene_type:complete